MSLLIGYSSRNNRKELSIPLQWILFIYGDTRHVEPILGTDCIPKNNENSSYKYKEFSVVISCYLMTFTEDAQNDQLTFRGKPLSSLWMIPGIYWIRWKACSILNLGILTFSIGVSYTTDSSYLINEGRTYIYINSLYLFIWNERLANNQFYEKFDPNLEKISFYLLSHCRKQCAVGPLTRTSCRTHHKTVTDLGNYR